MQPGHGVFRGRVEELALTQANRIICAGGGSPAQEARLWAHFATLVGASGRVLNLPWAQPNPGAHSLARWATTTLGLHGIEHVTTLGTLDADVRELERHDAVLLGGGNTYQLLERLRTSGFARALRDAIAAGMPCYGGSAGAIVLGADIGSAAHLDTNAIGLRDLTGLDTVAGHVVWCHYRADDDARIASFAVRAERPVIALPENAGATFAADGTLAGIGPGTALRWSADGQRETLPAL